MRFIIDSVWVLQNPACLYSWLEAYEKAVSCMSNPFMSQFDSGETIS